MKRIAAAPLVVLLGGAALEEAAYAQATDTTTQGDWVGQYGSDGYILANFNNGSDLTSLPGYINTATWGGASRHVWSANAGSDVRAVESPDQSIRKATTVYAGGTYTLTLDVNQPANFQLGVYSLDWDGNGARSQNIGVTVGGAPAGSNSLSSFQNGIWTLYNVSAASATDDVVVTITRTGGANAVVSAITFDPIPEPASLGLLGLAGLAMLRRRR